MFKVIITCDDCTGVDPMGCNDGFPWELGERFDTKEQAEAAGEEETDDCGPWRYEVVEIIKPEER